MSVTINFGKHKGELLSVVPCEYLIWCAENMADPPKCVVEELARRSTQHGSRQAANAAAAVASLLFRAVKPKPKRVKQSNRKRQEARQRAAEAKRSLDRQRAADRLKKVQSRPAVGEDFNRLRLAFAQAGGEDEACPFDTDDEPYTGPSLSCSGGRWSIAPPEFPPEFA